MQFMVKISVVLVWFTSVFYYGKKKNKKTTLQSCKVVFIS